MHKVVFLAFEGIELLDLSGPQTAFYEANCISNNFYELSLCGFSTEVIRSEAGTQIIPDVSIYELDEIDTLVIPG
ncbi:MAG: AraC family transcriptional regulator, partial [Colwelliaceae bacterium]|nr:AraC family transcriptional regulator [Colwelliaceae bacterium]